MGAGARLPVGYLGRTTLLYEYSTAMPLASRQRVHRASNPLSTVPPLRESPAPLLYIFLLFRGECWSSGGGDGGGDVLSPQGSIRGIRALCSRAFSQYSFHVCSDPRCHRHAGFEGSRVRTLAHTAQGAVCVLHWRLDMALRRDARAHEWEVHEGWSVQTTWFILILFSRTLWNSGTCLRAPTTERV